MEEMTAHYFVETIRNALNNVEATDREAEQRVRRITREIAFPNLKSIYDETQNAATCGLASDDDSEVSL